MLDFVGSQGILDSLACFFGYRESSMNKLWIFKVMKIRVAKIDTRLFWIVFFWVGIIQFRWRFRGVGWLEIVIMVCI